MGKEKNRLKKKTPDKEIKDSIGLFLKTVGNETFIIRVLSWGVTILFAVVLLLTVAIVIQSKKLTNIKPLVVYVDRDTGIAEVREFDVVDARNEKRDENEIWIFVNEFVKNLYDYTNFSQLRNLENAYLLCERSVQGKIKEYFIRDGRPGRVKSEVVGLCEVESVFIMDTLPDLRVRVIFRKRVIQRGGTLVLDKKIEAILRIKTVVRDRFNHHGLYITDYRETILKEKKGDLL
jgi:hypothetical protein